MATSTLTDNTGTSGYVRITWTNAEQPSNFYAWRLYHKKSSSSVWTRIFETLTASASYTHDTYAWANAVAQQIVLVYATRNPTTGEVTEGAYTGANSFTPTGNTKFSLVHPTDPTKTVIFNTTTNYEREDDDDSQVMLLLGADGEPGGKKINRGTFYGLTGSLEVQIRDHPTYGTATAQREALEWLRRNASYVWLRTPFGDLWKVSLGKLSITNVAGTGTMEAVDVSIPWEQVK
jgi:hypothetical protein